MTLLDTEMRPVAKQLILEYGKVVQFRRTLQSSYDPETGTGGDDLTPTTYDIAVTPPEEHKIRDINGSLISTGELIISMADLDALIIPNKDTDDVLLDSMYWNIIDIEKVWSGELVVMHTLRIGR